MKGRTANKAEKLWMNRIVDLGCIVCQNEFNVFSPASVHHLDGKTKEGSHLLTIPLCFNHHQSGFNDENCVSRHPHKSSFEKRYGTEQELLKQCQELIN
jgi:Recombination enhancement, RecA-dependent nuclease